MKRLKRKALGMTAVFLTALLISTAASYAHGMKVMLNTGEDVLATVTDADDITAVTDDASAEADTATYTDGITDHDISNISPSEEALVSSEALVTNIFSDVEKIVGGYKGNCEFSCC